MGLAPIVHCSRRLPPVFLASHCCYCCHHHPSPDEPVALSERHRLLGSGWPDPIRPLPWLRPSACAPPPPLEAGGGWALASCSMVCWRHLHASHTETLTSRLRLVPPSGLIQRYRSRRRASTRAPLFVEWQILSACSGLFGSWIRQWRALSKTTDHQQLEFLT